jgi:Ca-activated chloride channel family protein
MSRRFRVASMLLPALVLAGMAGAARGQGLIVDRRPHVPVARSFEVREVSVEARVRDQVADVQVSQTFHNPNSFELESEYLFPLPEDGAIQNFVLMVDGRELPGRLLDKDEARKIFEEIVRRKRDPALLEYMGRGLIRTRVFPIPPNEDRKVTLRYTKILPRDRDVVAFDYPFATQKFTNKPIERLSLTARIESKEPIKSLYSPSHGVEIERRGDHEAKVRLVQHDCVPNADFRLLYTLAEGRLGASVLSYRPSSGEDGYFLLLASPDVEEPDDKPEPKCVVFVLDRSGSMSGKKIEQAKGALKFVLDNLREGDTFNIVVYDDRVETYKPELQRYDKESRAEAIRYVENIYPGGSTNIDAAIETALGLIHDDSRPNYVLFLTDGLPTAGDTSEPSIAEHAKKANEEGARVFSFGVGYDVNARLLDRISGGNGGTSVYVKPDEDIEAHVASFYAKLTSPVFTDIALEFSGTDVNRMYPRDVPDLFEGGQLVLVGRYRESGRTKLKLAGKVGDERQTFTYDVKLAEAGEGHSQDFVETLWAVRRVGFLIDQIDLHGSSKELTDELVELSKKYGILTPYTAFLADEQVQLHAQAANGRRALDELERLNEVAGQRGVAQRAVKGGYQRAERFGDVASAPAAREPSTEAKAGFAFRAEGQDRFDAAKPRSAPGPQAGQMPGLVGGGGLGGQASMFGAGMSAAKAPAANAAPVLSLDADGNAQVVGNVRRVGGKTFFRRGSRWVDETVTPEQEAKAQTIEQFSDAYFELARKQSADLNQYLTFEEPVTINLGGQTYKIERPKSN